MDRRLLERISIDPHVLHGKPRIKGTRIAVFMVLELLAEGISPEEICSERFYPDLKIEDVRACVAFANQFLSEEEIHFSEELGSPTKT
ncbi:MAG: DUF433 domain-containing protein [Candidatus Omnitrophota bacterium]